MKLKSKIISVSLLSIIIFCFIAFLIQKKYVLPTYKQIEQSEAGKDLCLAVETLKQEEGRLAEAGDAIAKLLELKPEYLNQKMPSDYIEKIKEIVSADKLNFCGIYTNVLKYSWMENIKLPQDKDVFDKQLLHDYELIYPLGRQEKKQRSGLINSDLGILIICSTPVIVSKINIGTVITGFQIDDIFIERFSQKINTPIEILKYDDSKNIESLNKSLSKIDNKYTIYYNPIIDEDDYLKSFVVLPDINDKACFIITAALSRTVYKEAYSMIDFAVYALIILGIILIVITAFLIHVIIIVPIIKLTKSTIEIRKSENLGLRTGFENRKDEVGSLSKEFNNLLGQIQKYIENIRLTREDTIFRLSMAIDNKDIAAGSHITRVSKLVILLAQKLGLDKKTTEIYGVASTMHDIGKIGVPDTILFKEGKYSDVEFNEMKSHTIVGGKIFSDGDTELIKTAHDIALYHHERWDGKGYPHGLSGENIPLSARIVTIVDVFDAMLSKKTYKDAHSIDESIKFIENGKGTLFDPQVVTVFLENIKEFIKIRDEYSDK